MRPLTACNAFVTGSQRHLACCCLLMRRGADVNAADEDGR